MNTSDYTVKFFERNGDEKATKYYTDTTFGEVVEEMQAVCYILRAHTAKIYKGGTQSATGRCIKVYERYY